MLKAKPAFSSPVSPCARVGAEVEDEERRVPDERLLIGLADRRDDPLGEWLEELASKAGQPAGEMQRRVLRCPAKAR